MLVDLLVRELASQTNLFKPIRSDEGQELEMSSVSNFFSVLKSTYQLSWRSHFCEFHFHTDAASQFLYQTPLEAFLFPVAPGVHHQDCSYHMQALARFSVANSRVTLTEVGMFDVLLL